MLLITKHLHFRATVLYDRPPKIFQPLNLQEKHNWFLKIGQQYEEFRCTLDSSIEKTAFTKVVENSIELNDDRPGLLFSSTSWTPDEDFSVLMEALQGILS